MALRLGWLTCGAIRLARFSRRGPKSRRSPRPRSKRKSACRRATFCRPATVARVRWGCSVRSSRCRCGSMRSLWSFSARSSATNCCISNVATPLWRSSKRSPSQSCGFIRGSGCCARASAWPANRSSTHALSRSLVIGTRTCAALSTSPVTISRPTSRRRGLGCCVLTSCARASMPCFRRFVCRADVSLP